MSEELQSTTGDATNAAGERRSSPEERCGHTHEASAISGLGGVCCWRPVWGDTDRCIWHADIAQKPTRELEDAAPTVGERLDGAIFRDVELSDTDWLAEMTLTDSRFVNCNLEGTDLGGADLRYSHFEGVDAQRVNLRGANLEHVEFDRTDLREADLCGARLYYVVFEDARIAESTTFGDKVVYEEEIAESDDLASRLERYEATYWTYGELQRLTKENGLTQASRGYYLDRKDVRRREAWDRGSYSRALAKEAWRWTTGYGSNPWRVMATSAFVIVLCALLYPVTGGIQEVLEETGTPIQYVVSDPETSQWNWLLFVFGKSLYFSTVTFATLGYGDIQPLGGLARAIAGGEALLGQLLMALLVFVLSRNVTWSE
ncbi:pentapeptide repeat-containing protein [Halorussus salinisoli]|uniref:pentapeptide repeat-containing protein n=1 Tax=Halorussus salinisoli TaxID=2558242 RepID=UPI0010C21B7E|nr:pentapeptide repeat-containing protein [Halorussus salinisoli]